MMWLNAIECWFYRYFKNILNSIWFVGGFGKSCCHPSKRKSYLSIHKINFKFHINDIIVGEIPISTQMCNKLKEEIDMHICHVEVLNTWKRIKLLLLNQILTKWLVCNIATQLLCNRSFQDRKIAHSNPMTHLSQMIWLNKKKTGFQCCRWLFLHFWEIKRFLTKRILWMLKYQTWLQRIHTTFSICEWNFVFDVVVVVTKNSMLTRTRNQLNEFINNFELSFDEAWSKHFDYSYHFCNHVCESYLICKAIFDIIINSNFSIDNNDPILCVWQNQQTRSHTNFRW